MNTCTQPNCGKKHLAKGFCSFHYELDRKANGPRCSEDGCVQSVHGHGRCLNHYLKARRRKEIAYKACSIDGCERVAEQSGVCYAHHFRIAKYGDPDFRLRLANGEQTSERKKETAKKCQNNYRATPHGRLRQSVKDANRRLREGRGIPGITREQSARLWQTSNCGICGGLMFDEQKSLDHCIPLARGGANDIHNLQMAHLACNQRKSDRLIAA